MLRPICSNLRHNLSRVDANIEPQHHNFHLIPQGNVGIINTKKKKLVIGQYDLIFVHEWLLIRAVAGVLPQHPRIYMPYHLPTAETRVFLI